MVNIGHMGDDHPVYLPCPKCGERSRKTLGWLKQYDKFVCSCGSTVILADYEIKAMFGTIEQLNKAGAEIGKPLIVKNKPK